MLYKWYAFIYVTTKEIIMALKRKAILLIFIGVLLVLSCTGCHDTLINLYKNPVLEDYKEATIQQIKEYLEYVNTASANNSGTEDNTKTEGWTVLLYLNGTDLESESGEATKNLNSILSVELPSNAHVIIYTGGTKRWLNNTIDSNKNQIWEVEDGELKLLESYPKKSIGKSSTLSEFLIYGQNLYPNTKRALFLWDHGAGAIAGFGSDEHFHDDELFMSEINEALSSSFDGTKYDIIGFDACLMACVEIASVLEPYADFMVASEETEPGGGWNYEYTFEALKNNPEMSGQDLGIAITDGYYKKYQNTEYESMTTCSVIDLSQIPKVEEMLGQFAAKLTTDIQNPERLSAISSARNRCESYGEAPESVSFDIVDLYNFVELQKDINPDLSTGLMTAIEDAIVYEVSGSQRLYSYGLSIYFPFSATEYFDYCLDIYKDLDFCNEYYAFITDFAKQRSNQSYLDYAPDYEPELEEVDEQSEFTEDAMFYVQLTNEEFEFMEYVYCTLGWAINDEVVLDLGYDSDLNIDFESRTIYDDFDKSWTGLNGQLVSLYVMEETKEYVKYNIPVLYNGKKAIVAGSWIWDSTNAEGGYYKYNGIFYANEDFSAPNTKFTIDLKAGDEITPTYTTLFGGGDYEGYYEGEPFTVDEDGLYLEIIWLPDGDYYYGFMFIDKYGEQHYTDYTPIQVWSE